MAFDIYTNRVPFGLLTEDEQRQLQEHDGVFEYCGTSSFHHMRGFSIIHCPSWSRNVVYRAVRPAPTKPSINWDHVSDEFIAMATDKNQSTWLYEKRPSEGADCWIRGGDDINTDAFASFVPGTCHWKDSLVIRPGADQ